MIDSYAHSPSRFFCNHHPNPMYTRRMMQTLFKTVKLAARFLLISSHFSQCWFCSWGCIYCNNLGISRTSSSEFWTTLGSLITLKSPLASSLSLAMPFLSSQGQTQQILCDLRIPKSYVPYPKEFLQACY